MPYQHNQGFIFGTVYNITYQHSDNLEKEILKVLNEVDSSLSMFNSESVISKINRNEDVSLNEMFIEVFEKAQRISADTDGAFDITVAPLVNHWGFGTELRAKEDSLQQTIDSLRLFVGYDKVKLSGKRIVKSDPRMMLDCSAIAKGFGSDKVAQLLSDKGISNFMVEIGGEIVAKGKNEKGDAWHIGVAKPDDSTLGNGELQTVLTLSDIAMATSGNYRNFYYQGDKKYAHTIDPRTGRPVQHTLLSATVMAPTCAMADAYATAFMVMGMDRATEVLKRHPEMKAYFIYSGGTGEYLTKIVNGTAEDF